MKPVEAVDEPVPRERGVPRSTSWCARARPTSAGCCASASGSSSATSSRWAASTLSHRGPRPRGDSLTHVLTSAPDASPCGPTAKSAPRRSISTLCVPAAVHQAPRRSPRADQRHRVRRSGHADPRPDHRQRPGRPRRTTPAPVFPRRPPQPAPLLRAPTCAQRGPPPACSRPCCSFIPGDFICDLFLFDADVLRALRTRLAARRALGQVLHGFGPRQGPDNRFGEWTAYAVFCLDVIHADVRLAPSTPDFFGQIHSRWDLVRGDRFPSRVVHFVAEPNGAEAILDDLLRQGRNFC